MIEVGKGWQYLDERAVRVMGVDSIEAQLIWLEIENLMRDRARFLGWSSRHEGLLFASSNIPYAVGWTRQPSTLGLSHLEGSFFHCVET